MGQWVVRACGHSLGCVHTTHGLTHKLSLCTGPDRSPNPQPPIVVNKQNWHTYICKTDVRGFPRLRPLLQRQGTTYKCMQMYVYVSNNTLRMPAPRPTHRPRLPSPYPLTPPINTCTHTRTRMYIQQVKGLAAGDAAACHPPSPVTRRLAAAMDELWAWVGEIPPLQQVGVGCGCCLEGCIVGRARIDTPNPTQPPLNHQSSHSHSQHQPYLNFHTTAHNPPKNGSRCASGTRPSGTGTPAWSIRGKC